MILILSYRFLGYNLFFGTKKNSWTKELPNKKMINRINETFVLITLIAGRRTSTRFCRLTASSQMCPRARLQRRKIC